MGESVFKGFGVFEVWSFFSSFLSAFKVAAVDFERLCSCFFTTLSGFFVTFFAGFFAGLGVVLGWAAAEGSEVVDFDGVLELGVYWACAGGDGLLLYGWAAVWLGYWGLAG